MAEDRLTPAALKAVRDPLGSGVNLAEISTWADEKRAFLGAVHGIISKQPNAAD
jgi:hypothetical protein